MTRYRSYNPTLGRWISRDLVSENGGNNLFAYVSNDPLNAIDPFGLRGEANSISTPSQVAGPFGGLGGLLGPVDLLLKIMKELQDRQRRAREAEINRRGRNRCEEDVNKIDKKARDAAKCVMDPIEKQKMLDDIKIWYDREMELCKMKFPLPEEVPDLPDDWLEDQFRGGGPAET